MAFAYSPKIVTDGLVLYLDAANPYSYVSGSTVWNDLSKNQLTSSVTYTNLPTYTSSYGGGISFNGVATNLITSTGYTLSKNVLNFGLGDYTVDISLTVSRSFGSGYQPIISAGNNLTVPTGSAVGVFVNGNSGNINMYNNIGVLSTGIPYTNGQPLVVTFVKTSTLLKAYKNGNYIGAVSGVYFTSSLLDGDIILGTYSAPSVVSNQLFVGSIHTVKAYSKALSDEEILQNYNATKGRFGLK